MDPTSTRKMSLTSQPGCSTSQGQSPVQSPGPCQQALCALVKDCAHRALADIFTNSMSKYNDILVYSAFPAVLRRAVQCRAVQCSCTCQVIWC
jgi:hypothetical protein